MAKAETFIEPTIRRDGTSASLRDYTSLLGVVAAGILGMSLLCITSAIALSNPDPANPIVLEPASIMDMAISNLNTVSALTVQAVSTSIDSTPTLRATDLPASLTLTSSAFPTAIRITQTNTRRPRSTATFRPPPTFTPKPPMPTATWTPVIIPTNTPTNVVVTPPTIEISPTEPVIEVTPPTATEVPTEPPVATPTEGPTINDPIATPTTG